MSRPEEEIELARRIKKGDNEALKKLTKANLRFVVSFALFYTHTDCMDVVTPHVVNIIPW